MDSSPRHGIACRRMRDTALSLCGFEQCVHRGEADHAAVYLVCHFFGLYATASIVIVIVIVTKAKGTILVEESKDRPSSSQFCVVSAAVSLDTVGVYSRG